MFENSLNTPLLILQKVCLPFHTVQKTKISIKDLFSKCDQIRTFLRIWSHLLKKILNVKFHFLRIVKTYLEMGINHCLYWDIPVTSNLISFVWNIHGRVIHFAYLFMYGSFNSTSAFRVFWFNVICTIVYLFCHWRNFLLSVINLSQ